MTDTSKELLSEQGPFADHFAQFSPRQSQLQMAEAVENAFEQRETLLVEAGTGTGKTYAYLVPALCFDGKTVISTGTKNLQDQLFYKDLPAVMRAIGRSRKVALLKGRQNYLCLHRLEQNLAAGRFSSPLVAEQLVKLNDWARSTKDGDLSQVNFIQNDFPAAPLVTSTADNCLGSDCPAYSQCHVAKARKQAMDADIVVVNHHLLMADLVLKEDGFGELLPHANAYVIDEAHQLPEVASNYFGESVSSRKVQDLCRDAYVAYQTDAPDCKDLRDFAESLETLTADLRLSLGDQVQRQFWKVHFQRHQVQQAYDEFSEQLASLSELLMTQAERSRDLESLAERAQQLVEASQQFVEIDEVDNVQWLEVYRRSFALHITPLDISGHFQKAIDLYRHSAWVFTSATLAVASDFDHFSGKLGLNHAKQMVLPSPFDYPNQAMIYQPRYLLNPSNDGYTDSLIEHIVPLLDAARGRAFLLFTSHRALNRAAELLEQHSEFNCFVQGTASKSFLLDQFRRAEHAVLLGTFSFWEGVDVAGEALSFVAIDKLPFASPGDPVMQARITAVKKQGGDAFRQLQLPQAVIALKQGAGRLIRDVGDRGVLLIADPRIVARDYGELFLTDLPPMLPTRDAQQVIEFLREI